MPRAVSQLGLPGGPAQSFPFAAGVEKAPDSMRLLHASTEGATLHRQSRHRVFHRAPLGAAIAYVTILTVALLILVCARRLSNLSVEGDWVRSLAGAEGDEPAGACGGDGEGGGRDEGEKEDKDGQWAIIQQARENLKGFQRLLKKWLALKGGHSYKAVATTTSVFTLMISDVGALGGFIEQELLALRPLWRSVLNQAAAGAKEVGTGWDIADRSTELRSIHCMNGYLKNMMFWIRETDQEGRLVIKGSRWAALRDLVTVQAEVVEIASQYLSALHPESSTPNEMRRRAFGRLGGLSNARRRMLLANAAYARYFDGFFLKGFAQRRFGSLAAKAAQKDNLPNTPEGQIEYLRRYFPTDLRVIAAEAPTATETYLTPGAISKDKRAPKTPRGPWPSLVGSSLHPSGPLMHPPGPPSSSHPKTDESDPFVQLGARPKTYSQAVGSGEQTSSGVSSKKATPVKARSVQHTARKPGTPKIAPPPIAFPWGKDTEKQPGSAPASSPQEPQTLTPLSLRGYRRRLRKERGTKEAAPKKFASPTEEEGLFEVSTKTEGEASEGLQGPDDEIAQALKNLVLTEEEESTADDGDEVDEALQPLDGTPFDAGQTMLAPLPTQSHTPFLSSPWAAPGIPMGPRLVGVGPSSASRGGAYFGEPQGLPRPSGPGPWAPPIFSASQPSTGGPSHVLAPESSGLGPLPQLPAPPGFWEPPSSSPSLQVSPGPLHPPSTQPSPSGDPFPRSPNRAISGPTSTQPSPKKDKHRKGKTGPYRGMPLGEPAPPVTSVSTSPPT
ncbi:hypothetical protein ACSSS7_004687 [Eimeria intestinalis]